MTLYLLESSEAISTGHFVALLYPTEILFLPWFWRQEMVERVGFFLGCESSLLISSRFRCWLMLVLSRIFWNTLAIFLRKHIHCAATCIRLWEISHIWTWTLLNFLLFLCCRERKLPLMFFYVDLFLHGLFWHAFLIINSSQRWLPGEAFVIFVVSTTGQGDMPDSMKVSYWSTCVSDTWVD